MTTDSAPAPLTPADCDCTDLDGFMLNVEKLMASELVALSTHEVIGAALLIWCRAWKQTPAASLPDDDRTNAAFARLPLPRFKKLKSEVMRGFVKCSDGRLYHRTLAAEAVRAFERKTAFRKKRETDAERLRKWRKSGGGDDDGNDGGGANETLPETQPETRRETRFVAEGQGQGRDVTGGNPTPPSAPEAAREPAALDARAWFARCDALVGTLPVNGTSPAFANVAPLRALCEPKDGQAPCDWELDVEPAVRAVAAAEAPSAGLYSFAHPAIARIARKNRDLRLKPETDHEQSHAAGGAPRSAFGSEHRAGGSRPQERDLVGAALRGEARAQGLADEGPQRDRDQAVSRHLAGPARCH